MNSNSTFRYFIGFLITIGLVVLIIVLFFGGGDDGAKVPETSKRLQSYSSTDAQVRLTVDGPINANSEHQQVRITVGKDQVSFAQYKGYDGSTVATQNYENTENAYYNLLRSLMYVNYTKGNTDKSLTDERGFCPDGARYVYELIENGRTLQRFWSTSCGGTKTYEGDQNATLRLFQSQVPNYDELIDRYNFQATNSIF